MGKAFIFMSKNGSEKSEISGPDKDCKASQVVMQVLQKGNLPEGLKLQFAPSYGAHFISRKGQNALGYFNTRDTLIINGIAKELKDSEFKKDLVQPQSSKNYWAIKLHEFDAKKIAKLASTCARVLGFSGTGTAKKAEAKASKRVAKPKAKPVASSVASPA